MNSVETETTNPKPSPKQKSPRQRHRPPPIKIERNNSWSENNTPYDPPSPPNKNKTSREYATFL